MVDTRNDDERIDAIGRRFSAIFIALLGAMFVYGYLTQLLR